MSAAAVRIGARQVGSGHPAFVIAEAGVNHNGDIALAHRLVDAAVAAGADAVKFQAFTTEDLITRDTPKAGYQVVTTGSAGGQREMLKRLELGSEQHAALKDHCDRAGIVYLCTAYDHGSADLLERLGAAAFKVASTDTTNVPLLRHLASKGRPVILSTGMSELSEVTQGVDAVRGGGADLILMQCTSEYPVPVEDVNLRAMATLREAFDCPVGYSDHTAGLEVPVWAVAAGACAIEKHFTLDRAMAGPDHRASLEPAELSALLRAVRTLERALGDGVKRVMPSERANKRVMQKSLVAARAVRAGERFDRAALVCKRPATGLPPAFLDRVVGRPAARDVAADEILSLSDVDWETT